MKKDEVLEIRDAVLSINEGADSDEILEKVMEIRERHKDVPGQQSPEDLEQLHRLREAVWADLEKNDVQHPDEYVNAVFGEPGARSAPIRQGVKIPT